MAPRYVEPLTSFQARMCWKIDEEPQRSSSRIGLSTRVAALLRCPKPRYAAPSLLLHKRLKHSSAAASLPRATPPTPSFWHCLVWDIQLTQSASSPLPQGGWHCPHPSGPRARWRGPQAAPADRSCGPRHCGVPAGAAGGPRAMDGVHVLQALLAVPLRARPVAAVDHRARLQPGWPALCVHPVRRTSHGFSFWQGYCPVLKQ